MGHDIEGLLTRAILFTLAAVVGGLTLMTFRLREKSLPPILSIIHGFLAAAALVAVIIIAVTGAKASALTVGLILFAVAALCGFVLVSFRFRRKVLPIPLMMIHGMAAMMAFVLLVISAAK